MKERPILFNGPMVSAILEGRKTQTRRIIKPQPYAGWMPDVGIYHPTIIDREGEAFPGDPVFGAYDEVDGRPCPFGQPGDRLWVRETFSESEPCHLGGRQQPTIWYRADNNRPDWANRNWKPSIFMPRQLSRITLEINEIRVERLQDISEADALAEGFLGYRASDGYDIDTFRDVEPKQEFNNLWESINGVGSWDKNPWVWVVKFQRVKP